MGDHAIFFTFAWSIVLGIFLVQIAHKLRISAIVVLLLGGILAGPIGLGLVLPQELGQETLKTIVALAIGLILFEGGLTLNIREYRKVSREIKGLLTVGVIVTWLGTALCIYCLFPQFEWQFAFLAASLVIVTGPTVIGPLLKRIHAQKNLSSILHWEGILIDPIGVFIALLCYEWIISGGEHAVVLFFKRIIVGICFGLVSGFLISLTVKKSWIVKENINGFVLAAAIATFTLCESFVHESGLLSVIVAGFLIGYLDRGQFKEVKIYKAQLIEILIGMLFILLAANLNVYSFNKYGWQLFLAVLLLMVVIRPINVFLSTLNSDLQLKEKLFLCWIAPRGIVAASMASLFAISLKGNVFPQHQAQFLETFTYCVIIATVLLQGLTAKWVGNILGVISKRPSGWLIIGAHKLGPEIASFIAAQKFPVAIMDLNKKSISLAQQENIPTIYENALAARAEEYPQLYDIGHILAITPNESLNILIYQHFKKELSDAKVYACRDTGESSDDKNPMAEEEQIWKQLPLRRLLNLEEDEEVEVVRKDMDAKEIKKKHKVLLCHHKGIITPFLPEDVLDTCTVLKYNQAILSADLNLKENWVLFSNANNISDVLRELLEELVTDFPQLSLEKLQEYFGHQHQEHTSLFGYDVALYDVYLDEIDSPIVAIAKLKAPITLFDNQINIVFLVICPSTKPQKHSQILSKLLRFFAKAENRKLLRETKNKQELLRVFF